MTDEQVKIVRRRKVITGAILLIVLLLPVTAVLLAITDAYPGYVCGNWWYGMIVTLILGIQRISGYL